MHHRIVDFEQELSRARKLDPEIVAHLEAIRAAWLAIRATPLPPSKSPEVAAIRRGLWAQYATGLTLRPNFGRGKP